MKPLHRRLVRILLEGIVRVGLFAAFVWALVKVLMVVVADLLSIVSRVQMLELLLAPLIVLTCLGAVSFVFPSRPTSRRPANGPSPEGMLR